MSGVSGRLFAHNDLLNQYLVPMHSKKEFSNPCRRLSICAPSTKMPPKGMRSAHRLPRAGAPQENPSKDEGTRCSAGEDFILRIRLWLHRSGLSSGGGGSHCTHSAFWLTFAFVRSLPPKSKIWETRKWSKLGRERERERQSRFDCHDLLLEAGGAYASNIRSRRKALFWILYLLT